MNARGVGILSVVSVVVGCASEPDARLVENASSDGLPYYSEETFTPTWFDGAEAPEGFHSIPDFELTDQRGHAVARSDLEDRIYVANFFFTDCAGICPTTMASLTRLQAEFEGDDDVTLVSHSVAPEVDTVERLAAFADLVGAVAPRWYLLTGDRPALFRLGRTGYFADEDLGTERSTEASRFLHSESFFLVDQNHHIRGIYNGMNRTSVDHLIRDVRELQAMER